MLNPAGNLSLRFSGQITGMRTGSPLLCQDNGSDFDPEAEAMEFSAQIARMVAVTQALVTNQRHVDIQGLHDHVGLLCAKAMDLPPSKTGFLKLELKRLACSLAKLSESLRANAV